MPPLMLAVTPALACMQSAMSLTCAPIAWLIYNSMYRYRDGSERAQRPKRPLKEGANPRRPTPVSTTHKEKPCA